MAELVRLKVDVIVAGGGAAAWRAALQATSTIPVVVPLMGDPVASGLAGNLARPDRNITGLSQLEDAVMAKRLEFLKAIVPRAQRVAVLSEATVQQWLVDAAIAAARSLGVRPHVFSVKGVDDFEGAFSAAKAAGADGLVVHASAFFNNHRHRLVALSEHHRLAAVFENRSFTEIGGLMSYGVNIEEMYRGAARHVDRILKGAKPADLPIEQATKVELAINLKTAKALGLTIPPSLLLRADQVID